MEDMDIDFVMDVPDTPDRVGPRKSNNGGDVVEVHSSNSRKFYLPDKSVHHPVRDHGRLGIMSRSNRLFSHPQGGSSILNEAEQSTPSELMVVDSPPRSINTCSFRRMRDKQVSSMCQPTEHVPSSNGRTKLDGNTSAFAEMSTSSDRIQGRNKEKVDDVLSSQKMSSNSFCQPSGRSMRNKTETQGETSSEVDMGFGKGIHIQSDTTQKAEQNMSKPQQSITLPRKNGQRRLVRNGCISPHNIAKAKHIAESDNIEDDIQEVSNIRNPISEGNHTGRRSGVKGKGVMEVFSPGQEYNTSTIHSSRRSSRNPTEKATVIEDSGGVSFKSLEGMGGWRSTRNRSTKTSLGLPDEVGHLSRTSGSVSHFHEARDPVSFQQEPLPCSAQGSSSVMPELDRENEQHRRAQKQVKRQRKRAPALSNIGGCSTSNFDDSEAAFQWGSKDPSNARSTSSRSNHHRHSSGLVIEIDELSPEVRHRSPQSTTQMVNDDSSARARQVEADEMLARELQEQLYSEWPGFGSGEIDASLARTLQQEEEMRRSSSHGRPRVHSRDSSMSHLYRQYQFQNSMVRSANRANRGRAPSSARMTRLRDRLLSHSSSVSNGARNFQFPPNMDVEMRIHILEALEAAAGENVDMANFFQVHRDFNENDYEMLLALDEANDRHSGASLDQINGLPQSTVQSDSFDEICAVCLETPTTGDTIRHLPCLHKFHKDCIDPWLMRKTSCPVCKSGIT